jgi:hypothetical protein
MITDRINNNLDALFDIENDDIYKSLICDKDGINPVTINVPTDIKLGAITSQIEYLRRLSIDLVKQIYINQTSGEFLIYQLEQFFNSLRLTGESDAQWIARTIATVLQPKVSRASIIYVLRPYSTVEPVIELAYTASAYADFSYASLNAEDTAQMVLPDIAGDFDSYYFTFKIILHGTLSSDLYTIYNILAIMVAAGISYILEIRNP